MLPATPSGGSRAARRAADAAVEAMLSSLLGIEKARTLEQADRKQYGLAPPAAQVTVVTAAGKRTLEVGRELPGTDQRAVAIAGEPAVHAVSAAFWSDLVKPAGDWRSRELFAGTRDDVERVSLVQGGGGSCSPARRGAVARGAARRPRDPERFEQILDALTGLQAGEFGDQPPAPPRRSGWSRRRPWGGGAQGRRSFPPGAGAVKVAAPEVAPKYHDDRQRRRSGRPAAGDPLRARDGQL